MIREDTEPEQKPGATSGWDPAATPTTAPMGEPMSPLDPQGLAALLAHLARLDELTDPGDPRTIDSAELVRELRGCLRMAVPHHPADGWGRIGRFELLKELGRGGFGVVYKAFDPTVRRFVALKVPLVGGLALPELRRRFLREARAAGALEHPNIVTVFEAGEDGPLCYLAAAFVDGPTLAGWLRSRLAPVPAREAATLLAAMADAVQHAHDRGVLHRDLKPSNVLLQGADPGGAPTPRLTDFGLAKLILEAGDDSRSGVPMGSPSYMSPEQAAGRHREVGKAADVYGLGAVLYELLTGRPPHRGESPMETVSLVLSAEPVAPRLLRPGLARDLETICLTCLRKDPLRRYGSASALAADLRRWLAGEPIAARPISPAERLGRWARRHPGPAAGIGLAVVLGITSASGLVARDSWLAVHRAELEQIARETRSQKLLADRRLGVSRLKLAGEALNLGEFERAQDILDDLRSHFEGPRPGGFAWDYLCHRADREVLPLRGHHRPVSQVAVAPRLGTIASVDLGYAMRLWGPDGAGPPIELTGSGSGADAPRFSPDGLLLAAFEVDVADAGRPLAIALWDGRTSDLLCRLEPGEPIGDPGRFAFLGGHEIAWIWGRPGGDEAVVRTWSLDDPGRPEALATIAVPPGSWADVGGRTLAIAEGDRLTLIDPRTGGGAGVLADQVGSTGALVVSPDGRTVAACDVEGGLLVLWDVEHRAELGRTTVVRSPVSLTFSPDGATAALVDRAGTVTLLGRDGRTLAIRPDDRETDYEVRLAFSADGGRLALSTYGQPGGPGPTGIWGVADGAPLATYPGRELNVGGLAFGPDGRWLAIGGGPTLRRWTPRPEADPADPLGHADEAWAVAFSPDGRILATGSDDTVEPRTLKLWDVATGDALGGWKAHPATVSALAFSPDGRLLASAGLLDEENLRLWDPRTGALEAELVGHTDRVRTVAFSPDGRLLASAGSDCTIRLWDVASRGPLRVLADHDDNVRRIAFSPDGRTLASCDNGGRVRLSDPATGLGRVVLSRPISFTSLAFSPDGRTLAVADEGGSVTLLDVASGAVSDVLRGDDGEILALAFSPDTRALAAAGASRAVRLWDPIAGLEVLTLDGHAAQVNGLAFSPDGRTLASCSHDGMVRLWRSAAPGPPAPSLVAGRRAE